MLRCINGLEPFQGGEIRVRGTSVGQLNEQELRQLRGTIGMIFQDFALLERKTVLENVCLPMECWKRPISERREKAISLLKKMGLEKKLSAMPCELSGGQKQRVAIARALTLDPQALLCDEPASALDPQITESMLDLLAELNSELGITIVVVTHEVEAVKRICDRVAIIAGGVIALEGTSREVFINDQSVIANLITRPRFEAGAGKAIVRLAVTDSDAHADVLCALTKVCAVSFRLLYADMSAFKRGYMGHLYLEIDAASLARTGAYLTERGVAYQEEAAAAGRGRTGSCGVDLWLSTF